MRRQALYFPKGMENLSVIAGDITRIEVDAIVNAANERMLGGGGVDGAIHRAAGPDLLSACRAVREVTPGIRCPVGEARFTPGFRLPAKYVIHTVGPRWHGGTADEPKLLANCNRASLRLAVQIGIHSIAFSAISTGIFGYPLREACQIAATECVHFLEQNPSIVKIILVGFRNADADALREAVKAVQSARA